MRRLAPLVVCLVLLAAAAPAEAGPRRAACDRHLERGDRVMLRTRHGMVFERARVSDWPGFVYGCLYSQGKARKLSGQLQDGSRAVSRFSIDMDGRYVAYGVGTGGGAATVELWFVHVFDVRRGRLVRRADAFPRDDDSTLVWDVVVKGNGSVAWIGSDYETNLVQRIDRDGHAELDRGPDIEDRSIVKAPDERSISWIRGGEPRSAPLR